MVAIMMRNGPNALEVMLATRWIGAQWCPINWHFKTALAFATPTHLPALAG